MFYQFRYNSKVKFIKLLKEIYYWIYVKLNLFNAKKKILIVKNDAIGDYIIFNSFLNELRNSTKFKTYTIDLLTNDRLNSIILELNGELINKIHTTDKDVINYWNKFIKYFSILNKERYEYIIHPTYSPNWETHYFIKYIRAKHKVGFDSDLVNISPEYKKKYNPIYNKLIYSKHKYYHEFERNKEFFETILETDIKIDAPKIPTYLLGNNTSENQILICPGAQHEYRRWNTKNISELINKLKELQNDLKFIVAVSNNELNLYYDIKSKLNFEIELHLISGVIELSKLMKQCKFVLSNDSSAAHIAVACNSINICISNANNFNRFVPYPKYMNVKQTVILPPALDTFSIEEKLKYFNGSNLDINSITVDTVFYVCKNII